MKSADAASPEKWAELFGPFREVLSAYEYVGPDGGVRGPVLLGVWFEDGAGDVALDTLQAKISVAAEALLPYPIDVLVMNRGQPILTALLLERGRRVYGRDIGNLKPGPEFTRWVAKLDEKE